MDRQGIVAGTNDGDNGFDVGVIWHDGAVYALNELIIGEPDLHIYTATAISANGLITALAVDRTDNSFPVLLTPVPTPSSLALIACGLGAATRRSRRG